MIIGPAEYDRYKVPCQILMDRVGIDEMDVTQIELLPNGDVTITALRRDSSGRPIFLRDELLTFTVSVP